MSEADRIAAALAYQEQMPAMLNPNLARQGARGRANMMPPTSIMDERYPAFKRNQEDVEKLMLGVDLVGSAIPLAGPAMKGAKVLGQHAAPQLAQALENYAFKTGMALPMVERQAGRTFAAPQDKALRLAQERAALPVEQGGLGLPPNNTSEQRAAAMGFDTEAFHITPKEFSQFKVGGYDPTLSGEAIWLSPYKDVQPASHNVGGYPNYKEGSRILPLFVKVQKPLVIDDPTSLDWAREVFAGGSKEFPQLISPKSAKELQLNNEYKSILFQGEDLGWGNKSNEIMIFNPSDIRSRFAAFDPFRRNAATAAAMGVAAPDLLAKERNK